MDAFPIKKLLVPSRTLILSLDKLPLLFLNMTIEQVPDNNRTSFLEIPDKSNICI